MGAPPVGTVHEVVPGVFWVPASKTNFYLLAGDGGLTLIDAGFPRDYRRLLPALTACGHRLEDLRAIVLTHGHADHIGPVERLRRELGVPVLAHVREAPNIRGERVEQIGAGAVLTRLWRPSAGRFLVNVLRNGGLTVRRPTELSTFAAEAPLDVPGRPVPVFTPGHTAGHCAYHLPDRGVLFSGDALTTSDELTGGTGPRVLCRPFHADPDRAVAALARLEPLAAGVVLPGHGEPLRASPAEAVRAARAGLDRSAGTRPAPDPPVRQRP